MTDSASLRQTFAGWLTSPKNPYFAKAGANKLWANFFGRGQVRNSDIEAFLAAGYDRRAVAGSVLAAFRAGPTQAATERMPSVNGTRKKTAGSVAFTS